MAMAFGKLSKESASTNDQVIHCLKPGVAKAVSTVEYPDGLRWDASREAHDWLPSVSLQAMYDGHRHSVPGRLLSCSYDEAVRLGLARYKIRAMPSG